MGSPRKERLAQQVKDVVSRIILSDLQDPRMGFVTVTGVSFSSDLRHAVVRISVLGDEKVQAVTLNVLRHAKGYIQKRLGKEIRVRYIPSISFEPDDSIKKSIELSKAMRQSREA
ncbi:MAG: 30S ribosome-binding factor RbfA [Planctomycetes bacterium]|nr:30S ribosome-binding factor RbfA [Planctomycetota bacterium]